MKELLHIPQSIRIVDLHQDCRSMVDVIFSPSHIFPLRKLGSLLNPEHVRGPQSTGTVDLKVIDKSMGFLSF
jgi:hypothetical protein